jgi:hydroxypyruvate isomerase
MEATVSTSDGAPATAAASSQPPAAGAAPRFAPNLRWLFTELPLEARFEAAARAGFDAIEFSPHREVEPARLARLLADAGLSLTNGLAVLDWHLGVRGNAGIPGATDAFRDSAERSLDYAARCAMPTLHVPPGELPEGASRDACLALYADNLAWIAERAAPLGVRIVFEPVCRARFPRFLLNTLDEGAAVIARSGRDDIGMVFDTFHVHMQEGAASLRFAENRARIAYVQIGNPPGRHEPGEGELDLHWFVSMFVRSGYDRPIGLEYVPRHGTARSLEWARRYGVQPR